MEPGAAGEQSVPVTNLDDVLIGTAGSDDGAGGAVLPQVHVMLGIEGDDAFAGGAGGGLDANAVLQVRAQQAVGIGVPQVGFAEERKLLDVIHGFDIVRSDAFFFHQVMIVGDVVPYVADLLTQLFVLDLQNFLPGRRFDFRLEIPFHQKSSFTDRTGMPS